MDLEGVGGDSESDSSDDDDDSDDDDSEASDLPEVSNISRYRMAQPSTARQDICFVYGSGTNIHPRCHHTR